MTRVEQSDRFLVVGGGGWIGRAVTMAGQRSGLDVRPAGREWTDGFLRASTATARLRMLDGVSGVANCTSTGASSTEHAVHRRLNRLLADACRDLEVAYVSLGSAAEYGDTGDIDACEDTPARPITDYGKTKLAVSEHSVASGGFALRIFNIIGPEPPAHTAVGSWVHQLKLTTPQLVVGNSSLRRDFVGLDFVSTVVISALRGLLAPGLYNVCSGKEATFGQVVTALAQCWDFPNAIEFRRQPAIARVVGCGHLLAEFGLAETRNLEELARLTLLSPCSRKRSTP